jgi:hypothetical protein
VEPKAPKKAMSSETRAEDAVSDKLSSDKLSLISAPNSIAKLGLVRDERRR